MKKVIIAAVAVLGIALVGCTAAEEEPTFEEKCSNRGGSVLSDSTSKLITGTVTGTVIASNGSVGVGTGVATSPVTFTVSLCIVSGETVDMEVR